MCFLCSHICSAEVTKIQNEQGLIYINPKSFTPSADVKFQFSDGRSIDAHGKILAAVSPVFERMFYGDFKEAKSKQVDLPAERYKSMKLLVDFIHTSSCESESLDDVVSLLELFEEYDINKIAILNIFSEAVLSQLNASNYSTLVPKYASLMSEEGHQKIAKKIISFTNNNFISNFDEVKDIREEVMLHMLQSDGLVAYEADILDFLIKWYNYQKEQKCPLQLTVQLFQSIRYSLIIPPLLLEKIASCECVDKKIFDKALKCVFDYCPPIENDDRSQPCDKPRILTNLYAFLNAPYSTSVQITLKYTSEKECLVSLAYHGSSVQHNCPILESHPLENKTYAFTIRNDQNLSRQFLLSIEDSGRRALCTNTINSGILSIIMVYDNSVYLRIVESGKVKSIHCVTGVKPFKFKLQDTNSRSYGNFDFYITLTI